MRGDPALGRAIAPRRARRAACFVARPSWCLRFRHRQNCAGGSLVLRPAVGTIVEVRVRDEMITVEITHLPKTPELPAQAKEIETGGSSRRH
jgi:hypothetical protein